MFCAIFIFQTRSRACLNLAVLVLLRAIEGNDTAAAPGNGQQRRQGMRSRDAAWRLLFH